MLNDVIKHYTLIFCSYILFTIDDITSCMYCGVHVGAPGLFLQTGVAEVVETQGKTIGCELSLVGYARVLFTNLTCEKKLVVKTICFDYYHYSCLLSLCVELLLVSSCSTFIDGFQAYCKNEHGWQGPAPPA
jgi:hypothetical protein